MSKLTRLSASKIQCLEKCAASFFYKYLELVPDLGNKGAFRGSICHNIFECLGNSRHFHKYIARITNESTVLNIPSIKKLIVKQARSLKLDLDEDVPPIKREPIVSTLDCIDKMILVGIKEDFINLGKKKLIQAELDFEITNENPKYHIVGFVDRLFEEVDTISFSDFKSSKVKYSAKDLDENLQAKMYLLAARKLFPRYKKRKARFVMLRFPDSPIQEVENKTDAQLDEFEKELEKITGQIEKFTYRDAQRNTQMPLTKSRGGGLCFSHRTGHRCPYIDPFNYYQLIGQWGDVIKSVREGDPREEKEGHTWIQKRHEGCIMWKNETIHKKPVDIEL